MHVLGMTSAVRSRGRKALGYVPVKTVADVGQVHPTGFVFELFHCLPVKQLVFLLFNLSTFLVFI